MGASIKSFIYNAFVVLLIVFVITNVVSFLRKPELSSPKLPYFLLENTQGEPLSSYDYNGKPLVLHFWATWCPTCKLEASAIEALSKEYDVITIAVNSGRDAEINAYLQERGYTFNVINDHEGKFASKFDIKAFPTTLIFDQQNSYVYSDVGYTSYWGLKLRLFLASFN